MSKAYLFKGLISYRVFAKLFFPDQRVMLDTLQLNWYTISRIYAFPELWKWKFQDFSKSPSWGLPYMYHSDKMGSCFKKQTIIQALLEKTSLKKMNSLKNIHSLGLKQKKLMPSISFIKVASEWNTYIRRQFTCDFIKNKEYFFFS